MGLTGHRSDERRLDERSLIPYKCDRSLVWDATCVFTLCLSHVKYRNKKTKAAAENVAVHSKLIYATNTQKVLPIIIYFHLQLRQRVRGLRTLWCLLASLVKSFGRRQATLYIENI